MGSVGVPLIPTLPSFTSSLQASATRFGKLQVASFIKVLRVPYVFRRLGGIELADSMRKAESHKTLTAFSFTLAVTVVLACSMPRVSSEPLPAAREARVTAAHVASFPISHEGTATALLTTGIFAPPAAPALGLTMADFTGDTHPDLATVELEKLDSSSARYWIEIRLTEGGHQILKLRAPIGGLLITPQDVTGDGNLDLVVRSAKSGTAVALFLNDGRGHFSRADIAAFARALRDEPSQFAFTTHDGYRGAPLAYLESYGAQCSTGPLGYLQEQKGSLLSSTYRGASGLFLPFGANRAPPSLA